MLELRNERRRRGLTQSEFGALIGRSQAAVSFIERGIYVPRPRTLKAIYDVLGREHVIN